MKICKMCGVKKPLSDYYIAYKNYPTRFRHVCKECENKKAKERGRKAREELDRLNDDEEEIISATRSIVKSYSILKVV